MDQRGELRSNSRGEYTVAGSCVPLFRRTRRGCAVTVSRNLAFDGPIRAANRVIPLNHFGAGTKPAEEGS